MQNCGMVINKKLNRISSNVSFGHIGNEEEERGRRDKGVFLGSDQ
jgi:hypothetical protein